MTEEFWDNYLKRLKVKLKELSKHKDTLQIDLHIHSNYSADGKQVVKEILASTKEMGFDVISITDHDTLEAYQELYNYVKDDNFTNPLVIPGIEFTIDNNLYGNQCHILQLGVNPCNKEIKENVLKNQEAMVKRSKIQFQRLKHNLAIQEILNKYQLKISFSEYKQFLNKNNLIYEYDTLCKYLMAKFKPCKINNFMILKLLEKYNKLDPFPDRREYKSKRYDVLKNKYVKNKDNYYNERFLLSLLGVREVDDDWWPKPISGSISVNSFGELKITELNKKFPTYFAHPEEDKLTIVEDLLKQNPNIIGLELNIRSHYNDINNFYKLLKKRNLKQVIGSDSHDNTLVFYQNKDFYQIKSEWINEILK